MNAASGGGQRSCIECGWWGAHAPECPRAWQTDFARRIARAGKWRANKRATLDDLREIQAIYQPYIDARGGL